MSTQGPRCQGAISISLSVDLAVRATKFEPPFKCVCAPPDPRTLESAIVKAIIRILGDVSARFESGPICLSLRLIPNRYRPLTGKYWRGM
jgi:hypothetical protein